MWLWESLLLLSWLSSWLWLVSSTVLFSILMSAVDFRVSWKPVLKSGMIWAVPFCTLSSRWNRYFPANVCSPWSLIQRCRLFNLLAPFSSSIEGQKSVGLCFCHRKNQVQIPDPPIIWVVDDDWWSPCSILHLTFWDFMWSYATLSFRVTLAVPLPLT